MKTQAGAFFPQNTRIILIDPRLAESLRHGGGEIRKGGAWPINHRDWKGLGDLSPFLPTMEALQIVGSHDPDEANMRIFAFTLASVLAV